MNTNILNRAGSLALLFIKEQLKEPIALFWIIISPCAAFYLLSLAHGVPPTLEASYIQNTAWFYAYISSNVAFFGFTFYIIGRRESGFIRSFIYNSESKQVFIIAQVFAYLIISTLYCGTFYLSTRLPFGAYSHSEFFTILINFHISYLFFCSLGTLLALLPINFQNANTLLSIISFSMLILGLSNSLSNNAILESLNIANPLWHATQLMKQEFNQLNSFALLSLTAFITSTLISIKFLRINPVWSRY